MLKKIVRISADDMGVREREGLMGPIELNLNVILHRID